VILVSNMHDTENIYASQEVTASLLHNIIGEVTSIQVGLEKDNYSIREDIGDNDLSLMICVNASTDVEFEFTVTISFQSGTAQGKSTSYSLF